MLFKAPTGKVHSSLVDHDRCVFIRNNAKTDYAALSELPVHEYESGDDCMNCESAIESEVQADKTSETPRLFEERDASEPEGEGLAEEEDDWEDEDDFVADPEKKEMVERDLGICDAEVALEKWEMLAERSRSPHGRAFWERKIADLKSQIEFVPESEKAENAVSEEPATEAPAVPEQSTESAKPARRPAKKVVAAATK
ncbi:hypothetical protein ACFWXK_15565 [Streptomyces sp. NPDC059070]|uniref:hypothetical protein n=1 Tax=Streptomyces sp. NPDC059070 TaxID=3346713 RepID=UPI0036A79B02